MSAPVNAGVGIATDRPLPMTRPDRGSREREPHRRGRGRLLHRPPRGGARPHHGGGNYVRLFGKSYKWQVTTASAGAGNRGRQSSTWAAAWPRAAGPASGRLSHFTNNRLSKRVSSCSYSDKSPQTSSLKQRNLSSPRPGRRRRGVPTSSMSRDTADERGGVHRRLPSPGKPGSQSRGRRGAGGVSGPLASSRPPPPRRPRCSRRWTPRHSRPTFCSSRLPLRAPRDSVGAAPHRGAVCRGPSGRCRGSRCPVSAHGMPAAPSLWWDTKRVSRPGGHGPRPVEKD